MWENIAAAAIGYLLAIFMLNALWRVLDYYFGDKEPTRVAATSRRYNFYNNGEPLNPNNKEVIEENIRVMEDSIEELRKYLRKLEEEGNKDE